MLITLTNPGENTVVIKWAYISTYNLKREKRVTFKWKKCKYVVLTKLCYLEISCQIIMKIFVC